MAFDASLSDVGTALLSGATLYIEDQSALSPGRILETMARHRISYADLPPSLLSQLDPSLAPASLQTIVIGGEVCPAPIVREWSRRVRLINVYGPTETTICASLCVCGPEWDRPSIGSPLPGVGFEIVGAGGEPLEVGETGELTIFGDCVALGYLGEPRLTAEKFGRRGDVRCYRTGDLARELPDGSYEFVGRADRQVKIHGQLVEPAEIELRLFETGKVTQAAVVRRAIGGNDALVAFFVPRATIGACDLRAELSRALPRWMIPSLFVEMESLPSSSVGKIDLQALAEHPLPETGYEAPMPGCEEKIAALFGAALGRERVGRNDDFFSMGGDSLKLLRLCAEATKAGMVIEPETLWSHPTVAALSALMTGGPDAAPTCLTGRELERLSSIDDSTKALLCAVVPLERSRPRRVLMTGASGFFGARLLSELLGSGVEEAVCIVRSASDEEAAARMERILGERRSNVRALAGDVTLPRFGLSERVWDALSLSVDTVFHSAAEVNLAKSFAELAAANVGGTREVLRFALAGRPKELHHISTLSVLLNANGSVAMTEEEIGPVDSVIGGYAQSKWVAERYLSEARRLGYRAISIHRLGLVTGDSASGKSNGGDLLSLVVKCLTEIGAAPIEGAEDIFFDVTPSDFAAKAVVEIARSVEAGARGVFHITGRKRLSLAELTAHMRSFGLYVEMRPAAEWKVRAARVTSPASDATLLALHRCLSDDGAYRAIDLFQATGIDFETTRADAILSKSCIRCPAPDEKLVHRYLGALCEAGFFAHPPERHEAQTRCVAVSRPPLGLTRAELYDAFLFKAAETPRILGFHLREISSRGIFPARLLEIGCGTGRLLRALSQTAERVVGMDPDEEYLERARERCADISSRISLLHGGFGDLEEERQYDIVTSVNGPLFYLHGPDERQDALLRIHRALVPGGLMIMDLANFPFLLRHYGCAISMAEVRMIGDISVSRRMSHSFDFHDSLWIHDDHYEARYASDPESEPVCYAERHVFGMMTCPELSTAIERAGFVELRHFEGWDSAGPGRCSGPRLLMSARRPIERR